MSESPAAISFTAFRGEDGYTCAILLPTTTFIVTGDAKGTLALRAKSGKMVASTTTGSGDVDDMNPAITAVA
jgi:hypothetical protein